MRQLITAERLFLLLAGTLLIAAASQAQPSFTRMKRGNDPVSYVPEGSLWLHDDWKIISTYEDDADGGIISEAGYETEKWYQATVPTTVLSALVENGVYPDPYVGMNNMLIPDVNKYFTHDYRLESYSHLGRGVNPWSMPYWYRTEFSLPADFKGKRTILHFNGINYRAEVWVNGTRISDPEQMVGMFRRFSFDISDQVTGDGTNALAVKIFPLDDPGRPSPIRVSPLHPARRESTGDSYICRNVAQMCAVCWDWVPAARDRNMGIWQDVWLEAAGGVTVEDPYIHTVNIEGNRAELTLRFFLNNASARKSKVNIKATIEPYNFRGRKVDFTVTCDVEPSAEEEFTFDARQLSQLKISNPALWWPAGYGEQNMYRLTIRAMVDGSQSHSVSRIFGIRTVKPVLGENRVRYLYVNGQKIRLAGGTFVPDFLLNRGARHYENEMRLMAEGNHTMVRIWGGGITPPDEFFNCCDRYGLLVWNEFWTHGANYRLERKAWASPGWTAPMDIFRDNAVDMVRRTRYHTSVAWYCGMNEDYLTEEMHVMLEGLLSELDPYRTFIAGSGGQDNYPEYVKEHPGVYSFGPYHWRRSEFYFDVHDDLDDPRFMFKDETGIPTMLEINSIRKSIPDYRELNETQYPSNEDMTYHFMRGHYISLHNAILWQFGRPASLTEYSMIGQLLNRNGYRALYEGMNKHLEQKSGVLLWKTNSPLPEFLWHVYDWYLSPTPGYYTMKNALKPLHIQYSINDGKVYISNAGSQNRELKAVISLYGFTGEQEQVISENVTAPAGKTTHVTALSLRDGVPRFLKLEISDASGRIIDRNDYFVLATREDRVLSGDDPSATYGPKTDVLYRLPLANVDAGVTYNGTDDEGYGTWEVRLKNRSDCPAMLVSAKMLTGLHGEEALPALWSNNYLHIMPGEEINLNVKIHPEDSRNPEYLLIEGWNVHPSEIELSTGRDVTPKIEVQEFRAYSRFRKGDFAELRLRAEGHGERIITHPVVIRDGDEILRTLRVGLTPGEQLTVRVPLAFERSGAHSLQVSSHGIECIVPEGETGVFPRTLH